MQGNVFGDPVTDDIVGRIYPHENITPELRAKVALQYINADDRFANCKDFVDGLKKKLGNAVSVLCFVYNATGHTSTFVDKHDWHGHICKWSPYPITIQNGQWGCFLHVGSDCPSPIIRNESESAVIYRGKNKAGDACDWMLAWDVSRTGGVPLPAGNHVYTQVREATHFKPDLWNKIKASLEKNPTNDCDTWNGCHSDVLIGEGTSPTFVGIMSLHGPRGLTTTTLRAMVAHSATED